MQLFKSLFAALYLSAAFVPLASQAQAQSLTPLLTPAELSARLNQAALRLVDIRTGKDAAGKTPYENGHISGSQSAPYPLWRGPQDNAGKTMEATALTQLIQRLGIDRQSAVVVVYEGSNSTDFGAAARVYWTLKTGGIDNVAILNGGVKAWREANLPLVTSSPAVKPSTYVVQQLNPRYLATRAEVEQIVNAQAKVNLLDARPVEFYEGETRVPAAKTPGTIKGAKSLDNAVWFASKESASLLSPDAVKKIAAEKKVADEPTVSFCNTGHWAATNWFVLSEVLGHKNVKLYPESMVEWSKSDLPMDNVPSRAKQLLIDTKLLGK